MNVNKAITTYGKLFPNYDRTKEKLIPGSDENEAYIITRVGTHYILSMFRVKKEYTPNQCGLPNLYAWDLKYISKNNTEIIAATVEQHKNVKTFSTEMEARDLAMKLINSKPQSNN